MAVLTRSVIALALLGIAAFCVYGLLSTGEAPVGSRWAFLTIYGTGGVGCAVGGTWLLLPRRANG
jgi:hypothetical protein